MTDHAEAHKCSNCGDPVAARRKSKTGTHWCTKALCVAAKQRFYYRHRSTAEQERLQKQLNREERFDLISYALRGRPRQECPSCHREDGIPGFVHPTPDWTAPCDGLGFRGSQAGVDWVALVWPQEAAVE